MNNYGDHYETHPFDLKYMLDTWAVRSSDVVWDPFVSSGHSQREIEKLGYQAYRGNEDVMKLDDAPAEVTIIVTNPPFSDKSAIIKKLAGFRVPFVLLVPTVVIQRDYFSAVVRSSFRHWHICLPNKSLAFHFKGDVQHLPIFKSCFIFSSPSVGPADLELDKVENVTLQIIGYDKVREQRGYKATIHSEPGSSS